MRSFHTLSRPSRLLVATLSLPLLMTIGLLNMAASIQADEFEDPTTPLEITFFDGFVDPIEEYAELYGQIQADDPGGLTVTFSGSITGTTLTDASGYFNYAITATPGTVTATVTLGNETDDETILME